MTFSGKSSLRLAAAVVTVLVVAGCSSGSGQARPSSAATGSAAAAELPATAGESQPIVAIDVTAPPVVGEPAPPSNAVTIPPPVAPGQGDQAVRVQAETFVRHYFDVANQATIDPAWAAAWAPLIGARCGGCASDLALVRYTHDRGRRYEGLQRRIVSVRPANMVSERGGWFFVASYVTAGRILAGDGSALAVAPQTDLGVDIVQVVRESPEAAWQLDYLGPYDAPSAAPVTPASGR